jgi:hypothetical protein
VEFPKDKSRYKYTPDSDASLRIKGFPHLVLEIISDTSQSDQTRMLLQAACLVRLGNALRKKLEHPIIVSAIYINDQMCAEWHLMYQRGAAVERKHTTKWCV